jgi:hypothetical protein
VYPIVSRQCPTIVDPHSFIFGIFGVAYDEQGKSIRSEKVMTAAGDGLHVQKVVGRCACDRSLAVEKPEDNLGPDSIQSFDLAIEVKIVLSATDRSVPQLPVVRGVCEP